MEPTQLISDDLLNSTALSHHGVKGMKWGVWNAETMRKYLGGKGRAMSAKMKKVGTAGKATVETFAKKKVSEVKASRAAKKQQKAEINQQRKELGMTRQRYEKLREQTLKSHDPRVVERGMKTLTDQELDAKLVRLKKEEQISNMSTALSTRKHNEHKARSEAIKANPLYGITMNIAGRAIKKATNGKVDTGDDTPKTPKKEESPKKTEPVKVPLQSRGAQPTSSGDTGKATVYGSNKVSTPPKTHVQAYKALPPGSSQKVNEARSWTASSSEAKKAAEKGKSYVNDNVIDMVMDSDGVFKAKK